MVKVLLVLFILIPFTDGIEPSRFLLLESKLNASSIKRRITPIASWIIVTITPPLQEKHKIITQSYLKNIRKTMNAEAHIIEAKQELGLGEYISEKGNVVEVIKRERGDVYFKSQGVTSVMSEEDFNGKFKEWR